MSAVSETIVREYFELHGFFVRQQRKYLVQTRREDDDVDFFVANPRAALDRLDLPQTDRERIWPWFWQYRGGFFAAHCHCHPDGRNDWTLEGNLPPFPADDRSSFPGKIILDRPLTSAIVSHHET